MSAAAQPLVSVITPVYNGETFLAECIESVLAQSHLNFEYVILDNASTDRTAEIIEHYATSDSRIRALRNKELLPQLENWNESMRHVSRESRYCKVVHADDQLLPECIARMVEVAERHSSVNLIGAYRIDGGHIGMTGIPFPAEFVSGKEICRKRLLGAIADVFGSPTSVMYRADAVRERGCKFYNLTNPHADTEACFELLRHGDYGFVHQVLTFTRRHAGAETPAMRSRGTHGIARVMIARDYGKYFLTSQEHRRAMDLQLRYHYAFLANHPQRLMDKQFRQQTDALFSSCGSRFRLSRLSISLARHWIKKTEALAGRLLSDS